MQFPAASAASFLFDEIPRFSAAPGGFQPPLIAWIRVDFSDPQTLALRPRLVRPPSRPVKAS